MYHHPKFFLADIIAIHVSYFQFEIPGQRFNHPGLKTDEGYPGLTVVPCYIFHQFLTAFSWFFVSAIYRFIHQLQIPHHCIKAGDERGRAKKIRKKDSLLSYLVNARGADEHSVEDITKNESGSIGINPAFGNTLKINKLEINNGQVTINSDQPIRIDFIPGKVRLLPVTNRGRTYPVPTKHLDNALNSGDPIKIAEMGVAFYKNYFKKTEDFFVK